MSALPLYGLDAVVLAGGYGTRLRPAWDGPKCLVPVRSPAREVPSGSPSTFLGRPVIDYVIDDLRAAGVERVILALGYQSDAVIAHVSKRVVAVERVHWHVSEPAGVVAALRAVARSWATSTVKLSSTLVVANGDTIVRPEDWGELLRMHRDWKRPTRQARRPGGTAIFDDDTGQHTGLYFVETEMLSPSRSIPADLLEASRPVSGRAPFADVGTPDGLAAAADFVQEMERRR